MSRIRLLTDGTYGEYVLPAIGEVVEATPVFMRGTDTITGYRVSIATLTALGCIVNPIEVDHLYWSLYDYGQGPECEEVVE